MDRPRPAELFALEWRDIHGEELKVRRQWRDRTQELVEHTKNYERRTVPLAPQVLEALEKVPRIKGQPFIFFTPTVTKGKAEGRLSGWSHSYYWHKVRDEFVERLPKRHWLHDADKPLTLYSLRHFFASEMSLRGVDTRDIATMLGHQDDGQLATADVHPPQGGRCEGARQAHEHVERRRKLARKVASHGAE
jgi:integrase